MLTLLVVFGATISACQSSDGDTAQTLAVRDSSGVTIVDNGALAQRPSLRAATAPRVEIGVLDGPEELQLFQVSDAKVLPDGGVVVANGGTRELKIYDADGTHRGTAGGAGQGPSEFGYPVAVRVLPADTVLVQDRVDRVYFRPDGTFIGRTTTDRQRYFEFFRAAGGFSEGGQWSPDGTFLAPLYELEAESVSPAAGPLFRPTMTLVRVHANWSGLDTLGAFGGILQQYVDVGESRPSATVPPFYTNTSFGWGAATGSVVAADNARPQVEIFHPDGTHIIARWAAVASPIDAGEIEEWKDRQRQASWAQDQLPQLERAWAELDLPTHKPYFGNGTTGSDGRTWLAPAEGEDTPWIVVAPDGVASTLTGVPGSLVVMDSGPGWVLGLFRDENDVESLHVYDLQPVEPAGD